MASDPTKIRLIILDVDGVLTTGDVSLDADGREIKTFNVRDGQGIRCWLNAGYAVAIITGRSSRAVTCRAAELGIEHVYQGSSDKAADFQDLLARLGIPAEEAAMVGDDLPDLAILTRVGFPVAVGDAAPEVKNVAALVTKRPGGCGAVREVIEYFLKSRDEWDAFVTQAAGSLE